MTTFEIKVLKRKLIDKTLRLKVTQNEMSGRILVEFYTDDGRMVVQKSFQDTQSGLAEATEFQKKFKSVDDLKQYLGYYIKENANVTK